LTTRHSPPSTFRISFDDLLPSTFHVPSSLVQELANLVGQKNRRKGFLQEGHPGGQVPLLHDRRFGVT
jgi:hypothetical protein